MIDQPAYGTPRITRHAPTVEHAPDRIRIPLAMLPSYIDQWLPEPDLVYVGHDPTGQPVYYRITGWDEQARALAAVRVLPQATREETR